MNASPMTLALAATLAVMAGGFVTIQPALNGQLGALLGSPLKAAFVNFCAGALVLTMLLLVTGARPPSFETAARVPAHLWFAGGTLGAFFVASSAWAAPRVGVAIFLSILVATQLTVALALDHFGVAGMTERPVTLLRVAGVGLLIAGAWLVTRG